jgi:hypothetical protein
LKVAVRRCQEEEEEEGCLRACLPGFQASLDLVVAVEVEVAEAEVVEEEEDLRITAMYIL